jgi:ATP-dependent RNA helicase SUPV3L1/SUV3
MTPPKAGLVSFAADPNIPHAYYYACGYRPSGARAVRIDMLERLAAQIRAGRRDGPYQGGFEASQPLMSLVGCSGEDFESILTSLGYRKQTIKVKKPAIAAPNASAPAAAVPADTMPVAADAASPENEEIVLPPEVEAEADSAPAEEIAHAAEAPAAPDAAAMTSNVTVESAAVETPVAAPSPNAEVAPGAAAGPAQGADEMIEVVIWKMTPRHSQNRRPRESRQGQRRSDDKDAAPRRDRDRDRQRSERGSRNEARGENAGRDRDRGSRPERDGQRRDGQRRDGPRRDGGRRDDRGTRHQESPLMTMPQHRKVADPNSPFAVLAGLKDTLAAKPDDAKAKEPETSS